jgi:hypothetical protein
MLVHVFVWLLRMDFMQSVSTATALVSSHLVHQFLYGGMEVNNRTQISGDVHSQDSHNK